MEVSLLPKNTLRIKGKQATFLVNPEKTTGANAAIYLSQAPSLPEDEVVVIDGPGEFEIGGVKISGIRSGSNTVYSFLVDGVDVLVGKIDSLEKIQHKVKEHAILLLNAEESVSSAAFATGLATSVLMAYGTQGKSVIDSFGKENTSTINKYSVTKDKLPSEMQTILLANGS